MFLAVAWWGRFNSSKPHDTTHGQYFPGSEERIAGTILGAQCQAYQHCIPVQCCLLGPVLSLIIISQYIPGDI